MIWIVVALGGICLVMLVLLIFWNRAIINKDIRIRELTDYYEAERHERQDAQNSAWNWESRYESLLAEYKELEELDEAEDYVRKSLGYPPDEDEDESKETA